MSDNLTIRGFEIVPFSADHAYEIELHPDTGIDKKSEIFDAWVNTRCCGGGWTALGGDGDMILCCGGIVPVWSGVGDLWFLRSIYVQHYPIATVKLSRAVIDWLVVDNHYHRIQSAVRKNNSQDVRFAHFLGLSDEGIMRKWGADKSDYIFMSRIIE